MKTVPSYTLPSYNIDSSSSATVANEAQYDYYYGDTAVSIASPSIVIDTESSTISVLNNNASSDGKDSTATVTMTTQVYSSPSLLSFELSNSYATLSAVNTIYKGIFTSYKYSAGNNFPITVSANTHNMRYQLDGMYTNSVLPCLSLNYLSLILFFESSRQFDQITLVLLTLLLLQRTIHSHLIKTFLLLLISNPYFDTISC